MPTTQNTVTFLLGVVVGSWATFQIGWAIVRRRH